MDEHQLNDLVQRVAKAAAKEAVAETFLTLGLDISQPLEVQADFRQLREWRKAKALVISAAIKTLIGAVVTFILGAVGWQIINRG